VSAGGEFALQADSAATAISRAAFRIECLRESP